MIFKIEPNAMFYYIINILIVLLLMLYSYKILQSKEQKLDKLVKLKAIISLSLIYVVFLLIPLIFAPIIRIKLAARLGSAKNQYLLAQYEKNSDNSELYHYWIKMAAMNGNTNAIEELAKDEYDNRRSNPSGNATPIIFIQLGVKMNLPLANYYYGQILENGYGVSRSWAEAEKYYSAAAGERYPDAFRKLAQIYLYKKNDDLDNIAKGKHFLAQAAELGDPLAIVQQESLPNSLNPQNAALQRERLFSAIRAIEFRVNEGNLDYTIILAESYYNAIGVPRDLLESYKWFNIYRQSFPESVDKQTIQKIEALKIVLNKEEISEAEARSKIFLMNASRLNSAKWLNSLKGY